MPASSASKAVQPDPATSPAKNSQGASASAAAAAKKDVVVVEDMPQNLSVNEDTRSAIDLSPVRFKNLGTGNDNVVVQISASSGTLDAFSNDKVQVVGSGTGSLQLIGKPAHVKNFFKDLQAIYYTGAQNDFGVNAAQISLSVLDTGASSTNASTTLASSSLNIEELPDELIGTPQDDVLTGDNGRDSIIGLSGNDLLRGQGGNDTIMGDAGNDTIIGGAGADILDGGADEDVLQYVGSSAGVSIDLNIDGSGFQHASGGDAEGDVISNFEHVYGTDFADTIIGDAGRNILFGYGGDDVIFGGAGDDVIRGGLGADTMDGGDGIDWLRYVESPAGVTVDLNVALQVSAGDAAGDVISGFENVQGSDFGDVIYGDANANYILGFGGDDVISGGAGRDTIRGGEGADTLDGGSDIDTLQYLDSSSGVTVDLRANASGFQSASGGDANGDVISGFENVYGSDFDDILTGDAARNILYGYDGDDILNGGLNKDVLRGGGGADQFVFNTALGTSNVDRILDFEEGIDRVLLSRSIFTALSAGELALDAFCVSAGGIATTDAHRIIYDGDTGNLYYDSDGNGSATAVMFASLTSVPHFDATDVFVF